MTCIVGFTKNKKVYMGADSAGVGNLSIRTRVDEKVFINGPFIMGYTTSYRMGQLLRFTFKPPKQKKTQTDYAYMCTTFITAIIKCFKDNHYAKVDNAVVKGGEFMVGYKSNLYNIQGDFQVGRLAVNYMACGCGEDYALGSMYSSLLYDPNVEPKKLLIDALRAAEEFSSGVRGPYKILSK